MSDQRTWPRGRISPDDDGEMRIAIAIDRPKKVVVIMFKKPTTWLGLPAPELREFVEGLSKHLAELEKLEATPRSE